MKLPCAWIVRGSTSLFVSWAIAEAKATTPTTATAAIFLIADGATFMASLPQILFEEFLQFRDGWRHELRFVIHINVRGAIDDEEFLWLPRLGINLITPEFGVGLLAHDHQHWPG